MQTQYGTIELAPENPNRGLLETKLDVYIGRLSDIMLGRFAQAQRYPNLTVNNTLPGEPFYKAAITDMLLTQGRVDLDELAKNLEQGMNPVSQSPKLGQATFGMAVMFDVNAYANACGVIRDYVSTGGRNLRH